MASLQVGMKSNKESPEIWAIVGLEEAIVSHCQSVRDETKKPFEQMIKTFLAMRVMTINGLR